MCIKRSYTSFAVSAPRPCFRSSHFSFQFEEHSWSDLKLRVVSTLRSSWKMSKRRRSRSRVPSLHGNRTSYCEYQRLEQVPIFSSRTRTTANGADFLVRKFTFKELQNERNLAPFKQLLYQLQQQPCILLYGKTGLHNLFCVPDLP